MRSIGYRDLIAALLPKNMIPMELLSARASRQADKVQTILQDDAWLWEIFKRL